MKYCILIILAFSTLPFYTQNYPAEPTNKNDSSHIKTEVLLNGFTTNHSDNNTAKELQNYKKFLKKTRSLTELSTYTKDSLKILAVKLISIKELKRRQLLQKDISKNKAYYINILNDLKSSPINPLEYQFLEDELSQVVISEIETKYRYSKWLNILLALLVLGLLYSTIRTKKGKTITQPLSKQEKVIKGLIIKGKTNKEIADELFISLSTVKSHISNIYQKLSISNRTDLITKFKNPTGTST